MSGCLTRVLVEVIGEETERSQDFTISGDMQVTVSDDRQKSGQLKIRVR